MASELEAAGIEGFWRAPGEARATAALLFTGDDQSLSVLADASRLELTSAPFKAVSISARVGSIPRRIVFADGSSFETTDNDAVDRLVETHGGKGAGLVHRLERFRPHLIAFVAVAFAICVAIYRFAVPALVEVAVWATPPVVPALMSRSVLASLDKAVFSPTKLAPERQQALSNGFRELVATASLAPDQGGRPTYALNFRQGGAIGANAFALPDGSVILTDELVALTDSDELVLGVLAHEIGHVRRQHSLRQLYRAAGVSALILLIGGDIGSGTEDVLVQGSALLSLSYSRGAEAEADRESVELMYRAGHDPKAIAHFFELLRDKLGDKDERDFLSTHPATPERIADTLAYADAVIGAAK